MGLIGEKKTYQQMFEDIWLNPDKIYAKVVNPKLQFRTTLNDGFQYRDIGSSNSNAKRWASLTKMNSCGSLLGEYRVWVEEEDKSASEVSLDIAINDFCRDNEKVRKVCHRLVEFIAEKFSLVEKKKT